MQCILHIISFIVVFIPYDTFLVYVVSCVTFAITDTIERKEFC